jgi:hypothetical protein
VPFKEDHKPRFALSLFSMPSRSSKLDRLAEACLKADCMGCAHASIVGALQRRSQTPLRFKPFFHVFTLKQA